MRPRDRQLASKLTLGLETYEQTRRALPGIADSARRDVFIEQILASVHRVVYAKQLAARQLSPCRRNPSDFRFDPIKAAALALKTGSVDEASWLVFLSTHFGKHGRGGWRYVRDVYGRLGDGHRWDWEATSVHITEFRTWLHRHQAAIRQSDIPGGFGNHRKYESLDGRSSTGTGAIVESYVNWVRGAGNHANLFNNAIEAAGGDGKVAFGYLYRDMVRNVKRFGRLARFDYLAMIGKLGIAPIEPGSIFLRGATGPLRGARLLFSAADQREDILDAWLVELDSELAVGMQVLEDALCNWQKSPDQFEPFRG